MCEERGAHLVSVETVQEKEWIVSLVSSLGKRRRRQYWTSGNDIEVEGSGSGPRGEHGSHSLDGVKNLSTHRGKTAWLGQWTLRKLEQMEIFGRDHPVVIT